MELYNQPNIPYYDIGNRIGHTDYIDFFTWDEITKPVMKGIDVYKRQFVVIKLKIYEKNIKLMQTFFQRHTNGSSWMGCGHATSSFIETSGGMNIQQIELLKQIINNQSVEIKVEHRPSFSVSIGEIVSLYDEEKENAAAIIIQKQWLKCRYNPKYKMCEKLQLQDYYEIISSSIPK